MKHLFESETALGRCDADRVNGHFGEDPGNWTAFAHTVVTMIGSRGMLRIEQRCYLRSIERPDDLRSQTWVRPEMTFEPMPGSKEETLGMLQKTHDAFVQRSRDAFIEQSLLEAPQGYCGV